MSDRKRNINSLYYYHLLFGEEPLVADKGEDLHQLRGGALSDQEVHQVQDQHSVHLHGLEPVNLTHRLRCPAARPTTGMRPTLTTTGTVLLTLSTTCLFLCKAL